MTSPLDAVARWVDLGWLREVDRALASFLAREAPEAHPLLLLGAALASHQLGRGHACLDLEAALSDAAEALALPPEGVEGAKVLAGVRLPRWLAALENDRLVGRGEGNQPLVLEGTRLYLRRYWEYERLVRNAIASRLADPPEIDDASLRTVLDAVFPAPSPSGGGLGWGHARHPTPDWQKTACALAARSRFAIITGGPGTGKTTTVVKLLAVLQHLALSTGERLRIRLAAPTGKAAARLNESIARAIDTLPLDALDDPDVLRVAIPREVTTVHRLLGTRPDSRRFRHDARNPLPVDVLVLDEASMVDLEMMAAVLSALPPRARLVLLGDKDQLASVEAGAVLGELCKRADDGHYLPATRDWLRGVTGESLPANVVSGDGLPLDQVVVKLRHSHRFSAGSGIGRLADAVNEGEVKLVRRMQAAGYGDFGTPDLAFVTLAPLDAMLRKLVLEGGVDFFPAFEDASPRGLRHVMETIRGQRPDPQEPQEVFDTWAATVLQALGEFQLLCAVRQGPAGVEQLNERVARLLREAGLTGAERGGWYVGRPVMVTRNDYGLGLMNGDVGITLELPTTVIPSQALAGIPAEAAIQASAPVDSRLRGNDESWVQRVAFPDGRGGVRWVLPSRLQWVETVYAMTVHKSQGSEFTHAALVLPDRMNRVLTRELVYTGVTRARQWFTLATLGGGSAVLEAAVGRRMKRAGGDLVPAEIDQPA